MLWVIAVNSVTENKKMILKFKHDSNNSDTKKSVIEYAYVNLNCFFVIDS